MIAEEQTRKEEIKLQLNFEISAMSDKAMVQRKDKGSMVEATYIGKQPPPKKKKKIIDALAEEMFKFLKSSRQTFLQRQSIRSQSRRLLLLSNTFGFLARMWRGEMPSSLTELTSLSYLIVIRSANAVMEKIVELSCDSQMI